ncbi:MAG: hypothetical protein U5R31_14670 [Acidimicrobiia bacterium]|nr:hypothetical protein [Acidimicrobiia bacterium]
MVPRARSVLHGARAPRRPSRSSRNRSYVDELLAPKLAERWYRERISISHHALQAIGLLWSYAVCARPPGPPTV